MKQIMPVLIDLDLKQTRVYWDAQVEGKLENRSNRVAALPASKPAHIRARQGEFWCEG